jgi:hypothetical protein
VCATTTVGCPISRVLCEKWEFVKRAAKGVDREAIEETSEGAHPCVFCKEPALSETEGACPERSRRVGICES